MAKNSFKDLKSLFSYIEKNIESIMANEVSEAVKDEMQRQVFDVVYQAYPEPKYPIEYERRGWKEGSGGLADREVMEATVIKGRDGITLSVVNMARGSDNEQLLLAPLVEYGDGVYGYYDYPYNQDNTAWKFLSPRPFIEATRESLKESGLHAEVLKQELNKKGIKTINASSNAQRSSR